MVARPIQPRELLELAARLAGVNATAGRPKTIELRRAISTAYYAVFHELSFKAANRLLGDDAGWTAAHAQVTRWITHTELEVLAKATVATGSQPPPLLVAIGQPHADLVLLSQNFVDLQAARHRADYDDSFNVSRALTQGYVASAQQAISASNRLVAGADTSYARFLGLAFGGTKVAKRR